MTLLNAHRLSLPIREAELRTRRSQAELGNEEMPEFSSVSTSGRLQFCPHQIVKSNTPTLRKTNHG